MTKAPTFALPDQNGAVRSLGDFSGKWLVLYFYPKDDTPGCTIEANDFTLLKSEFRKYDVIVIGVSGDDAKSHCEFVEKHNLDLILLTDKDYEVMKSYGAYGSKLLYGKSILGVKRSTFLINPTGEIVQEWRNIHADGHAAKVLDAVLGLQV